MIGWLLVHALSSEVQQVVYMATSTDGLAWSVVSAPVAVEADAPDVLRLDAGSPAGAPNDLLMYYTDRTSGRLHLLRSSNDGRTWSRPTAVTVEPTQLDLASPSVVQLPTGEIRLYAENRTADAGSIVAARSSDGINFTLEADCFPLTDASDPEVVRFGAKWLLFLSAPAYTLVAESRDGLSFSQAAKGMPGREGSIGAIVLTDGRIRIFRCGSRGMWSLISRDGITFTNESGYRLEAIASTVISDPSPFTLSDGRHALLCVVAWKDRSSPTDSLRLQ